jgi:archaeal type IV pilus assembly protein PilA
LKNFNRNIKAISPIFATLILIAIAVIAGVVVYMFTSGTLATMTNGGTAGQEKVTVQGASGSAVNGVTVYLEQTSGPQATVNGLIVKGASGNTVGVATPTAASGSTLVLPQGTMETINGAIALTKGATYTVTVTTSAGGSFVSTSFVATA